MISLDSKFELVLTYHEKDYNIPYCNNLKTGLKTDMRIRPRLDQTIISFCLTPPLWVQNSSLEN